MHVLLMLAMLAGDTISQDSQSVIEAKIRGTGAVLRVELLRRENDTDWKEVAHRTLPGRERSVRFAGLPAGVYQLRLLGPVPTEQLAEQFVLGANDVRRATIVIDPFDVSGVVTLGGTPIGEGSLVLRHNEFEWRAGIRLAADGSYRARMWQRGEYTYSVKAAPLTNGYSDIVEFVGRSPMQNSFDLPDGRIAGIVRDAKSGAPVAQAAILLKSSFGSREKSVQTKTDAEGRFDFTGMRDARHTVRVVSLGHLETTPITFELGGEQRLKELDVRLDPGRSIPIAVMNASGEPMRKTMVFAVSDGKLCSRAMTDDEGRASVAVPADEAATLFVVPSSGAFGVQRVARGHDGGRLKIYLPSPASSLLIRARTTTGEAMPPFSLLMRFNGEIVPPEVGEELVTRLGLQLMTSDASEALLRNIPSGSYEFWPYRTDEEAVSILAAASISVAPIHVHVRSGENRETVKFAKR